MTIRVNIAEAKAKLSALAEAALAGEEVILQKAGVPKLKLVPIEKAEQFEREEIARMRVANIGKFKKEFEGLDLSVEALKADRGDPNERFRRKFETPD